MGWKFYKKELFGSGLLKYLFVCILPVFINSCSPKLQQSTEEVIVYPPPPEKPRIQYLTSISTSHDVEKQRSSFTKFVAGDDVPKPIIKPYGIFVYGAKLYVCDLDLEGLEIIDLREHTFEYFVPKGFGQMKLPINCFVDSLGNLYVADAKRRQIVIYDKDLKYVAEIGGEEDYKPTDVFVKNNKIWVSNIKKSAVYVYSTDSTHRFLYSIPQTEEEGKRLFQPTNLFVTDDKVYVSDFGDFRIKIYDHKGEFLQSIGSYGRAIGQFTRPKGVVTDKEENVYVVDAAFENVQIFNKDGKILMFFGGSTKEPGGMWLPAKIAISYENLDLFQKYVDKRFNLKFLLFVTNNFGPRKINVYGFVEEK